MNGLTNPEIVWADPPPDGRLQNGGRLTDPRRVAMDANPGRWLLWGKGINASIGTELRKAGYETVARNVARSGRCDLYARRPEGWTPQ